MAGSRDSRKSPRLKVRVPNSLRIRVQDGECLADLLDISQSGVGVEFFDLFDVLIFAEGDVVKLQFLLKPGQVSNKGASEILDMIKGQNKTDEKGTETAETSGSGEEVFETDAKIIWTYLNRLGLEFVGHDS